MNWLKKNWGWLVVVVIAMIPLIGVLKLINLDLAGTGGNWISMDSVAMHGRGGRGGSEMVSGAHIAVKQTGEWAIRWIVAVLCLTPITILTGLKSRLPVRQAMGITAFVYAILHFIFFCLDKGWLETFRELGWVLGLISTLVMMVLAITSNRKSMKLLRKSWKKIHRWAYLAGVLAVLHVALLKHGDWVPYAILLGVGFVVRISPIKKWITEARCRRELVQLSNY